MCVCRDANVPLYELPKTHVCFVNWQNTVDKISEAAKIKLKTPYLDPWGSPYYLDENEGEISSNYCRRDTIRSLGPDGLSGGGDNVSLDIITFYDIKQCGR